MAPGAVVSAEKLSGCLAVVEQSERRTKPAKPMEDFLTNGVEAENVSRF